MLRVAKKQNTFLDFARTVPYRTHPAPQFQKYFVEFHTFVHPNNKYFLPLPLSSRRTIYPVEHQALNNREHHKREREVNMLLAFKPDAICFPALYLFCPPPPQVCFHFF